MPTRLANRLLEGRLPVWIPIGHFVVGFSFLLIGLIISWELFVGGISSPSRLIVIHLLVIGWVGITIIGAMSQFVPVWSGIPLHSSRLAVVQLFFLSIGLLGFAIGLFVGSYITVWFALVLAGGFVIFGYNIGQTLICARPWDRTEFLFVVSVLSFLAAVAGGVTLLIDHHVAILPIILADQIMLHRTGLIGVHVTLALFGGIWCAIAGALYQLAPMLTQSTQTKSDRLLQHVGTYSLPPGVALLALGRAIEVPMVIQIGGVGVAIGILLLSLYVGRQVRNATAGYSAITDRYILMAICGGGWAVLAVMTWLQEPLSITSRFGEGTIGVILLGGAIGFLIMGTLYHIVPFLIWIDRYSAKIGYGPIPTVDDLYNHRLERLELLATLGGLATLTLGHSLGIGTLTAIGFISLLTGIALFVTNMSIVILGPARVVQRSSTPSIGRSDPDLDGTNNE